MLPHGGEASHPLGGKPKSRRTARIAERIREIVSQIILFELKDPRIGFVTVLQAEVTNDVKEAKILLSVMGPRPDRSRTLRAINHSKGYIQRILGKQLGTRNTPVLQFEIDEKAEKVARLEETLDRIRQERLEREEQGEDQAD